MKKLLTLSRLLSIFIFFVVSRHQEVKVDVTHGNSLRLFYYNESGKSVPLVRISKGFSIYFSFYSRGGFQAFLYKRIFPFGHYFVFYPFTSLTLASRPCLFLPLYPFVCLVACNPLKKGKGVFRKKCITPMLIVSNGTVLPVCPLSILWTTTKFCPLYAHALRVKPDGIQTFSLKCQRNAYFFNICHKCNTKIIGNNKFLHLQRSVRFYFRIMLNNMLKSTRYRNNKVTSPRTANASAIACASSKEQSQKFPTDKCQPSQSNMPKGYGHPHRSE